MTWPGCCIRMVSVSVEVIVLAKLQAKSDRGGVDGTESAAHMASSSIPGENQVLDTD